MKNPNVNALGKLPTPPDHVHRNSTTSKNHDDSHQGKNPGLPDAAHFHSLIYRRVIRWATPNNEKAHIKASRNASTSPYLWLLSSLGVFPAILFWDSTEYLMISALIYMIFYLFKRKIVIACITRILVYTF